MFLVSRLIRGVCVGGTGRAGAGGMGRRIAVFGPVERAAAIARADSGARVDVIGTDWAVVDGLRERARRLGLDELVGVRHLDALRVAGLGGLGGYDAVEGSTEGSGGSTGGGERGRGGTRARLWGGIGGCNGFVRTLRSGMKRN